MLTVIKTQNLYGRRHNELVGMNSYKNSILKPRIFEEQLNGSYNWILKSNPLYPSEIHSQNLESNRTAHPIHRLKSGTKHKYYTVLVLHCNSTQTGGSIAQRKLSQNSKLTISK